MDNSTDFDCVCPLCGYRIPRHSQVYFDKTRNVGQRHIHLVCAEHTGMLLRGGLSYMDYLLMMNMRIPEKLESIKQETYDG